MPDSDVTIREDDLSGPEIAEFLDEHIREMKVVSPPQSKHALDLSGLRKPEITFWVGCKDTRIVGCGALAALDDTHGEIKSMRTHALHRGIGIASMLLTHIIEESRCRGYASLSLETGSMPYFAPARRLYEKFGFRQCGPFSSYREDPNSVFLTLPV